MCLRTVIDHDSKTGVITNRVVQRISQVRWDLEDILSGSEAPGLNVSNLVTDGDQELPYITIRNPLGTEITGEHCHVVLHIRKALLDTKSLGIVASNFALLYSGLPLPEHTPFASYLNHIAAQKDDPLRSQFWSTTLDGIAAKSLSGEGRSLSARNSIYLDFDSSTVSAITRLAHAHIIKENDFSRLSGR